MKQIAPPPPPVTGEALYINSSMSMAWMKANSFWLGWISFRSLHSPATSLAVQVFGGSGLSGGYRTSGVAGQLFGGRASLRFVLAELWPRAGSRTQSSGEVQIAPRRRKDSAGYFFWNATLYCLLRHLLSKVFSTYLRINTSCLSQ